MSLDLSELRELLAAINQTDIAELILKSDDFELTVRRGIRTEGHLYAALNSVLPAGEMVPGPTPPMPSPAPEAIGSIPANRGIVESPVSAPVQSAPPSKHDRRLVEVLSPMVGTFYRAPAPDEPPFVNVGDRIQVGQTVCIIEAMKLMNELEAEVAGEIVEILVQNGEPVEYGQPLMRVNPS